MREPHAHPCRTHANTHDTRGAECAHIPCCVVAPHGEAPRRCRLLQPSHTACCAAQNAHSTCRHRQRVASTYRPCSRQKCDHFVVAAPLHTVVSTSVDSSATVEQKSDHSMRVAQASGGKRSGASCILFINRSATIEEKGGNLNVVIRASGMKRSAATRTTTCATFCVSCRVLSIGCWGQGRKFLLFICSFP